SRVARRVAVDLQSLVTFEARQRDDRARRDSSGDGHRLVERPATGATPRHAQLDERRELARHLLRRGEMFDRRQLHLRVDEEMKLELGMLFAQADYRADLGRTEELIG